MDKVQIPSNPKCHTPSWELSIICSALKFVILLKTLWYLLPNYPVEVDLFRIGRAVLVTDQFASDLRLGLKQLYKVSLKFCVWAFCCIYKIIYKKPSLCNNIYYIKTVSFISQHVSALSGHHQVRRIETFTLHRNSSLLKSKSTVLGQLSVLK
jgi:hypothetical protein